MRGERNNGAMTTISNWRTRVLFRNDIIESLETKMSRS